MSRPAFNLDRLNPPEPGNDLALHLKPDTDPRTGKKRKGFETEQAMKKERKTRIRLLVAYAAEAARDPLRRGDAKAARKLAALLSKVLQPSDTPTFPNPTYTREFRRRFLGEVLRRAKRVPRDKLSFYTLVAPKWLLAGDDLASFDPLALRESIRRQLYKVGDLLALSGWFIMVADGEYGDSTDTWQPHVHVLCFGEKYRAFEALRALDMYEGGKDEPVHAPILVEQIDDDLPRLVSYLFKLFWPNKPGRRKLRIPEPHHTEWMLFFHRQSFSDLVWLHGLEIRRGRLRRPKKRPARTARS